MTTQRTAPGGTLRLGDRTVSRLGYGAMQLAGPGVMGPPRDPDAARTVLRRVVEAGVTHIDTSDFYGPHLTNQLIREVLHPYPDDLTIVTKVGARRSEKGDWLPAGRPEQLVAGVEDNLRHLGVETLDVVNLRVMPPIAAEPKLTAAVGALAELQQQGKIRHLGVSEVTPEQLGWARGVASIVCVQNEYNLAKREDDPLIDHLEAEGLVYVPYFPLGGFTPLQSQVLDAVASRRGVSAQRVALAWLLQRSPAIAVIPGTSSPEHLADNLAAADLVLDEQDLLDLEGIAG
ncbi:oxidoreductase [Nocardioides sp. TRM66260-LWL]|uniref:oxidoreductase n=1 Tax=Nocardioides sp. TRM66260-LWL TaxID=2874478 RepID=UPI001CC5A45D|nr:oxidoreductase [Nocardioides sp. TRM66260-LWL]MBZ5736239.1 oxidoreductase [Nocardioides sp. TRM66260-LWL]